ncbi:MAG: hypothetical protein WA796_19520, partial [Pseudolabrys sp.]
MTFGEEQPRQAILPQPEITPDCSQFITLYWMHPGIRALQPAHPQRSSIKAHIVNAQVHGLATAQTVPVH